ncbi:MAG: hypothetical protein ABH883_02690 [Candidatus Omnitrophota bacterium]
MGRDVILILISNRKKSVERVQKTLTGWGCLIKTRLGLHTGVLDECSEGGLIFLELAGDKKKHKELCRKLDILPGVSAKLVELKTKKT